MALYRDEGVVLRTIKLGEADKIITLMTRGRGKVRAVAKGVRKTSSRFGGRLEPTTHVQLQLYEGRELDTITQAETLRAHRAIRGDLERLGAALTVLEAVDQISQQGRPDPELFRMLLGALESLESRPSAMLVPAFLLKLLVHEGFRPELHRCVECGATSDLERFDLDRGGVTCRDCRRGAVLSPDAHLLMRAVLEGQLQNALSVPESSPTHEVSGIATRLFEHHLERRLRSVSTLGEG